ncbi:transglycosylase domain-containing protein [Aquibacillus kalidii]|uniref:transglycosylase domain-containing protein n=1 Tax=Aquibacillus kalidii TaxID=2762597 RepID=UPI002E2C9A7E|nr:transglycosylase domain-containing protein [Aquibacillus kalidii]
MNFITSISKIPKWLGKAKWPVIAIASMMLLAIIGYLFIIFGGRFVFDEKNLILPSTTKVITEDGALVGKLYEENRDLVTIKQIPDHVEKAFIAIEDQRFYEHAGISLPSVARAVYRDIIAMSKVEGGSTITQQLAKNLFLQNDKTWMRKTKEVMASIYLERNYSKDKILELYLNEIYFAHGIYGVGTAAQFYFDKRVEDLNIQEGAMLAALAKAPNSYSPINDPEKAMERRNLVLQQMNETNEIGTEEMLDLQGKTLGIKIAKDEEKPWLDDYLDMVIKEAAEKYQLSTQALKRGGYNIVVHLNEQAQKLAYEKFQDNQYFYGSTDGVQGAFVLMNQENGHLEVLIGGRDYTLGDWNRVEVARQPGSTMKPLAVYGPAMMQADYQPYTLLEDKKQSYDGYEASNADGIYANDVTMYDAIRESKNAPAVWLLNEIGIEYSKSYLEKMKVQLPDKGLSIALGGLKDGLTPIQLTEAYRTFIHNGEWISAHTIEKISDRSGKKIGQIEPETTDVFSSQVAWNMVRMLEAVVDNGTASKGEYTKALAGKTGSTQHPVVTGEVKDAWFVGFTPNYVTATWMGYDKSDEAHYLTKGSEAPTVLAKSILKSIDQQQQLTSNFTKPNNVEELPKPIQLPTINDLAADFKLGGFAFVKGKLTWTEAEDARIVYQIYQENGEEDTLIATVEGAGEYTLDRVSLFEEKTYYVTPYDPLTKREGTPSNKAVLSVDF